MEWDITKQVKLEKLQYCAFISVIQLNPKTVFWTNVGKIDLIYLKKNTSLNLSATRLAS